MSNYQWPIGLRLIAASLSLAGALTCGLLLGLTESFGLVWAQSQLLLAIQNGLLFAGGLVLTGLTISLWPKVSFGWLSKSLCILLIGFGAGLIIAIALINNWLASDSLLQKIFFWSWAYSLLMITPGQIIRELKLPSNRSGDQISTNKEVSNGLR